MALQIDDLLSAICTEVTLTHTNDFQKVYALQDDIEAKLAFDILVAYGFAAKVYHTPGKPSKLYIAHPTLSASDLEQTLSVSIAYAHALKQMKATLDQLCAQALPTLQSSNYTVSFVNAQPAGKQIMIQVVSAAGSAEVAHQPAVAGTVVGEGAGAQAPSAARTAAAAAAPGAKTVKKVRKVKNPYEDDFAAGPAVGRGLYPTKIAPEGGRQQETMRKRLFLLMFGNMATSSFATLMWLVLLGVLFTMFVFAKAFVCYDFVHKKSNSWYCRDSGQMTEEELRKQQQLERQKQLGLAPAEPPQ